jgi:hypothetical protein
MIGIVFVLVGVCLILIARRWQRQISEAGVEESPRFTVYEHRGSGGCPKGNRS